ncbi:polysaccharide deacetylase family protein [Cylindrospermopsis raciborskii]|uniref:polysaccharide deacetylase family protein n=1 Tax=Cylindrospermopsis raciborskii TaxID=77022 RepID=UPI0007789C69|nr:polysaccharide deacetylase family protein [Cylindrospermopsis raciborskii]MCZ2203099.1 polysaccharide deacetylase family protein [Cylindrospermopsis raciborskii PAMP2012]MCZ2207336.1 polysaccharide deacetylase family protein [Cylindrospermopsis raciborskii PAMP2011]
MGKIARKSTNYRTKREKDNSITDGKYLILMLLSSIVVGAITGWFFMTIKPVKKYSTTLPNSQNRNEDSLLKSSFNSPPVNSPTPVQLTTPPISNRFSGSPLPENTLAPKNVNLISELEKLQGTIEKLKNISQIQDPEKGLELTTKIINDLKESERLIKIAKSNHPETSINQYLDTIKTYQKMVIQWQYYFLSKRQLSNQVNQALKPNKKTSFINLSLQNKTKFIEAVKAKFISLTFDDGPTLEYTPKIVAILQKHQVKATFFVVGKRVAKNCEILKMIYQNGHEIANHSYTHPVFTQISQPQQRKEIIDTQESINKCLGLEYPTQWFRAPYGYQNVQVVENIAQLGLNNAQWVVDTNDWRKTSTVASISDSVITVKKPGVVLMHDGFMTNPNRIHPQESSSRQNTVDALEQIIVKLKSRGFEFATLSETIK